MMEYGLKKRCDINHLQRENGFYNDKKKLNRKWNSLDHINTLLSTIKRVAD